MNASAPKCLADIRNDFERGVFLAIYNSRQQRLHRVLARVILGCKHGLRGLLFSWPLYLLPLAAWRTVAVGGSGVLREVARAVLNAVEQTP